MIFEEFRSLRQRWREDERGNINVAPERWRKYTERLFLRSCRSLNASGENVSIFFFNACSATKYENVIYDSELSLLVSSDVFRFSE